MATKEKNKLGGLLTHANYLKLLYQLASVKHNYSNILTSPQMLSFQKDCVTMTDTLKPNKNQNKFIHQAR